MSPIVRGTRCDTLSPSSHPSVRYPRRTRERPRRWRTFFLSLVFALRKTLLLDIIVAPKFPKHPLAVGSHSIESFLQENPDDDVIELDNCLYPSEAVYMDTRDGFESLCEEAAVAVSIMRDEIDRLFFKPKDNSKNWLRNPAVSSAVLLSPGGGRSEMGSVRLGPHFPSL